MGLARLKRGGDKDPFCQWDKYQRIGGHVFQPPQMLFEFEVLPLNHCYFEGRSFNTGPMNMDSQPQLYIAPY